MINKEAETYLLKHGYTLDKSITCEGVMYKNSEGWYAHVQNGSVSYGDSPYDAIVNRNNVWLLFS